LKKVATGLALAGVLLAAGCSAAAPKASGQAQARRATRSDLSSAAGSVRSLESGQVLRLGYLEDFGSAPALAGLQLGTFRTDLRTVNLQPQGYLSDLDEVNALEHGQLDAAYLDPVAAVQAWQASAPGSIKIIAGAATGPSELVARASITRPAQLRGTRVEAPGDASQAAALSAWLSRNHLIRHVHLDGSAITTAGILQQFKRGVVSAAWEPAPLAQQLIAAGGHVLATLPASSTAGVLAMTQRYLAANPPAVRNLLQAQAQACIQFGKPPGRAAAAQMLASLTGIVMSGTEQSAAFGQYICTSKLDRSSIQSLASAAAAAHIIRPPHDLSRIYDSSLSAKP